MKEKINVELFFLRIKNTFLYTTVTPLYIFVSLWWLFFKNGSSPTFFLCSGIYSLFVRSLVAFITVSACQTRNHTKSRPCFATLIYIF